MWMAEVGGGGGRGMGVPESVWPCPWSAQDDIGLASLTALNGLFSLPFELRPRLIVNCSVPFIFLLSVPST